MLVQSGHIWQGRFKAFPTRNDDHLITVVRYVERNPLRTGLVARAEDWPWSSLSTSVRVKIDTPPRIAVEETVRHSDWAEFVNAPLTEAKCNGIRLSIRRDRPYGTQAWTRTTASNLHLLSSLKSRGDQGTSDPEITRTT